MATDRDIGGWDEHELARQLAAHTQDHPNRVAGCKACRQLTWRWLRHHYDPASWEIQVRLPWRERKRRKRLAQKQEEWRNRHV